MTPSTELRRYRKKPVVIEALQWDGRGESATQIINWVLENGGTARYVCADPTRCAENRGDVPHHIAINTLEGTMNATLDDFVIRGVQDEFYPCKSDIFEATYEVAD